MSSTRELAKWTGMEAEAFVLHFPDSDSRVVVFEEDGKEVAREELRNDDPAKAISRDWDDRWSSAWSVYLSCWVEERFPKHFKKTFYGIRSEMKIDGTFSDYPVGEDDYSAPPSDTSGLRNNETPEDFSRLNADLLGHVTVCTRDQAAFYDFLTIWDTRQKLLVVTRTQTGEVIGAHKDLDTIRNKIERPMGNYLVQFGPDGYGGEDW